jgi:hypothetical protein
MPAGLARFANIILIAAISGCSASGPPAATPSPTAVSVSFDGSYRGTIQLISTSSIVSGAQSNWCNTPPVISLSLQNNVFSYVLAHPNVPQDSGYSLSPAFSVAVHPDGSFDTMSQNGGAEMIGRITGAHMTGQINGAGCNYAFTAERS